MANQLTNYPMRIDTDIASWRTAVSSLTGIRATKIQLQGGSGGTTSGTVTITKPADGSTLYPPIVVAQSVGQNAVVFNEDVSSPVDLTWSDFAVTGVTATGTVLWIWWR